MTIKILTNAILIILISGMVHLYSMELILRGGVNETYDNMDSSQAEPEDDWVTNIMLGITARSEVRSLDFDLSGNINQSISAENSENNSNSQDLQLSINKSFSENLSMGLNDVFQHYPEAGSFQVLFGRGEDNRGYIANSLTLNMTIYATTRLFLNCAYNYSIMNNDSSQLSDSVQHAPGANIGYYFNSSNIIRLGYIYQRMEYDTDEVSRADSGYAEYEKHFTEQLRSVLQGGYEYLQSEDGESLSTRWRASIIDDIDVSDRITFNSSVFYGQGSYQYSGAENRLFGVSAGVGYVINEFINFVFSYSYTWNKSILPALEDSTSNRNIFSAGFSAVY
jgi:hypothetical protein